MKRLKVSKHGTNELPPKQRCQNPVYEAKENHNDFSIAWGSSVAKEKGYGPDDWDLILGRGRNFLPAFTSLRALRILHSPVRCAPDSLSSEVNRQEYVAEQSFLQEWSKTVM
jgi:hypothetical protein